MCLSIGYRPPPRYAAFSSLFKQVLLQVQSLSALHDIVASLFAYMKVIIHFKPYVKMKHQQFFRLINKCA